MILRVINNMLNSNSAGTSRQTHETVYNLLIKLLWDFRKRNSKEVSLIYRLLKEARGLFAIAEIHRYLNHKEFVESMFAITNELGLYERYSSANTHGIELRQQISKLLASVLIEALTTEQKEPLFIQELK